MGLLDAPDILLIRLTLPGIHGNTSGGDGGGRVVLGGEDVAGTSGHLDSKLQKGLEEDSGLNSHVETSGHSGAGKGLLVAVGVTEEHQPGHLMLGEGQLLAAPVRKGDVS